MAPNSPKERSHASSSPAPIPGSAAGTATRAEPGQAPVTERGRHVLQRRVDRDERSARGDDQKRRGDERLREHDPDPRIGQVAVEDPSRGRVRADDVQQQQAAHQRRQRERQSHERSQQP